LPCLQLIRLAAGSASRLGPVFDEPQDDDVRIVKLATGIHLSCVPRIERGPDDSGFSRDIACSDRPAASRAQ